MIFLILIYLFTFFLGLIVGSFLNCVIYRLQTKESFLKGRSFCPNCKKILSWQDLIPLLSFIILRGRCRHCSQKISWQYPLVELATGILFVLVLNYTFPNLLIASYWLLVACFLIIIFVYDLKHYIIPDRIVYPAIAIAFLYRLFSSLEFVNWNLFGIWNLEFGILRPILSAILAASFFLFIVLISRGKWMGVGDIKLAFFMGLILSWPGVSVALFLAFFSGAIIGTGLIISGKKGLKSEVPFGPFLVSGTLLTMFFGEEIISWYFALILLK